MKTLQESLFDADIVSKEMVVGDVWKFDTPSHFLSFWSDNDKLISMFFSAETIKSFRGDKWNIENGNREYFKFLKRFIFKRFGFVSEDNPAGYDQVVMLINLLMDMPLNILYSGKSSSFIRDDVKKYLLKYCKPSAKNNMDIWVDMRDPSNANIDHEELTITISKEKSKFGKIKLQFTKR